MKLHYKTRNRIFYALHLWPLVLLQSRLRLKLYPKSDQAKLWLEVTRQHYLLSQEKNPLYALRRRLSFAYNFQKLILKVAACEGNDLSLINHYMNRFSHNRDTAILFFEALLGQQISLGEKANPLLVKYAKIACQYFSRAHPAELNNSVKDLLYTYPEKYDQLSAWIHKRLDHHRFYEVTREGYEEQFDFSLAAGGEIAVVAENYDIALGSLISLPKNCRIKFYLIAEQPGVAANNHRNKIFHQDIEFYNLLESVVSPWSEVNYLSVKNAGELARRSFAALQNQLELLNCTSDISLLKDSSVLCIEDLILQNVKIITAINEVFKNYEQIYLSLGADGNLETSFFSLLNNQPRKRIFVSAFGYLKDSSLLIRQNIFSSDWHGEYIKPLFINRPEPRQLTPLLRQQAQRDFAHYHEVPGLFGGKREYVFCAVNLRDDNYSKAAKAALSELLKHISVVVFYNVTKDKKVRDNISEIKAKAGSRHKVEFVPFTANSFAKSWQSKRNLWQLFVLEQILAASSDFTLSGIDYRFVIKHGLKNYLLNYLPAKIRLRETLNKSFAINGKPKSALLMPMRTSFTWLFADILRQNEVKILDQQVLFQSNHPRYKPSKANVVSLLNNEQIDIYKATFPVANDQQVTKFGSILYKLIQERIDRIDVDKTKDKYELPKDKKIIVIATQNTLSDEFLTITSHIAKFAAAREDTFLVVKLHPKEDLSYIAAYNDAVTAANARNISLVTTSADMYEMIKVSDIVVTIFSNVGMEAALSGKDVIVANLSAMEMPIDLARQGLALEVRTDGELNEAMASLLKDNSEIDLKKARNRFIEANIEIIDGKVLERIAEYLVA